MDRLKQRDFANIPLLWEPKEGSGKRVKDFMKMIEAKYQVRLDNYWDLHKWSIENLEKFWAEIWDDAGIIYSKPFKKIIDLNVPIDESLEWFEGARFNLAENLLRYRDDYVAIIAAGEDKETEKITYSELYKESELYAAALRKHGIKKGDRISCFMSNRKEAVYAMIATASIGAIWMGALPMMGAQPVLNRFKQVEPKVLFTIDRFPHNREEYDMLHKLKEIAEGLQSLEKVIIVPSKAESKLKDISGIKNGCFLDEFLKTGLKEDGSVPEMVFEQLPITHPVFISYTSGTTGLPKPLVHHSGCLLTVYRDYWLQSDSHRSDCWLSMSPVGWASWNQFTIMHFFGITIVLFEGMPFFLTPTFLWDMIDELKITNMILTPSVLDELEKKGYLPTERHHLNSVKFIMSGASVVKPQNYDFVYKKIKPDIVFSSIYGCTEIMGICLTLEQTLKIYQGETNAPSLGVDIDCVDDAGKPLIGEIGEVIIRKPLPSLTSGLWGDTDRSLFKKTYFEKFPGMFAFGDLALINPVTKGYVICGRSDDTLKPRGCRFGCSEIYNIVDRFLEVFDSMCVSQYSKNMDERAVLFLKMRKGYSFNEDLVGKLKAAIARELSIRHVPEVILETSDIPRNLNGKKMEITVKKIINKMPYNPETISNPECLKNFSDIPELQGF